MLVITVVILASTFLEQGALREWLGWWWCSLTGYYTLVSLFLQVSGWWPLCKGVQYWEVWEGRSVPSMPPYLPWVWRWGSWQVHQLHLRYTFNFAPNHMWPSHVLELLSFSISLIRQSTCQKLLYPAAGKIISIIIEQVWENTNYFKLWDKQEFLLFSGGYTHPS